jgi:hypothetical protein
MTSEVFALAISVAGTIIAAVATFMAHRKAADSAELQVRFEDDEGSEHLLVLHDPEDREKLLDLLDKLDKTSGKSVKRRVQKSLSHK